MANLLLRPPPVIDGVIGLHGGDHAVVGKAFDQRRAQMLGMLDPEAPLSLVWNRFVDPEHLVIRAIADGVNGDLKVAGVRVGHKRLHPAVGHRLHRQAAVVGVIGERLEKRRCRRAERTVGKSFQSADAQAIAAEGFLHGCGDEPFVFGDRGEQIDARRQQAILFQALIGSEVFERFPTGHVAERRHAEAGRFGQRRASGSDALVRRCRTDHSFDVRCRRVFQDAGRFAARIARTWRRRCVESTA